MRATNSGRLARCVPTPNFVVRLGATSLLIRVSLPSPSLSPQQWLALRSLSRRAPSCSQSEAAQHTLLLWPPRLRLCPLCIADACGC